MRQMQLVAHGEPSDVIELNTAAEPMLGAEEIVVSMEAAPLNPSGFCPSVASTASDRPSHPR